ncbi:hypothetical protein AGMMS4956_06510 [Bacteroidia bacterium]|nr:hypothetical protein AGMMS4956_06510 [Bacteroidia bacterium]
MNNLFNLLVRFRGLFLFLILEGLAFVFIVNHSFYPQTQVYNALQTMQNAYFTGAEKAIAYFSLKQSNEYLANENADLRNQLDYYKQQDTARSTFSTSYMGKRYTHHPAKIAQLSTNKQYNFMSIDAGELQGVHSDMGVVAGNSIVGIVVNTSPHFASVMSLLNLDFKISARLKRNGYIGSLMWDGIDYREMVLNEVPQHALVMVGDTVETTGYSALFPESLLIGTVMSYNVQKGSFLSIRVRLAIDFKKLQYVEVIHNNLQTEQRYIEDY